MTDPRIGHVIRIQNKPDGPALADGTPSDQVASDDSIWADVLRLDQFRTTDQGPTPPGQDWRVILRWQDGPDDDPNKSRAMTTLKITNPADDSQWFKVDVIEQLTVIKPNGTMPGAGTGVRNLFHNDSDNRARIVDVVTVVNTDVSALDMSSPVPWTDYEPVLIEGTQDRSQSLDVEVPKLFKTTALGTADPPFNQGWWTMMKNQDVEDAINQTPGA